MQKKDKTKAKRGKVVAGTAGLLHIKAYFNNLIVCATNNRGEVISWSSSGKMGFRGSKKSTPYAAQMAAKNCAELAYEAGLRRVRVRLKGAGPGREAAVRAVRLAKIDILSIQDVTPIPHNGCRPSKRRRM